MLAYVLTWICIKLLLRLCYNAISYCSLHVTWTCSVHLWIE